MRKYQRGFWNFVIPAIASVGSALIGKKGQEDANDQNLSIAREQMEFNAAEADEARAFNAQQAGIQRDWQSWHINNAQDYNTHMANTTYQRAVGDLQKAGLNPMLAYSQGGAPSPSSPMASGAAASGPAASAGGFPRQENAVAAGLNAAAAAVQIQNMAKQGDNIDADTLLKKTQAERETASAGNLKAGTEKIITGEIPKVREEIKNIQSDTINKDAQKVLIEAQTMVSRLEQQLKIGEISNVDARTALAKIETALRALDMPERQAYSEKFKGEWGKEMSPYMRELLDAARVLIYGASRGRY